MAKLAQVAFVGGEVSPSLAARVDLARYSTALKACRNFFVRATGGVSNRPGTEYVNQCTSSTAFASRLVPFVFSTDQAYVLELENFVIRPYADGALIQGTTVDTGITNIVDGLVGVNIRRTITMSAVHGLTGGEQVLFSGINATGTLQLNGQTHTVLEVPSTTVFRIIGSGDPQGSYISGGTAVRPYTITTPYTTANLGGIRWTQSADVLTFTTPVYGAAEFTRTAATTFAYTAITFTGGPFLADNETATTVIASAATGAGITLTASASIFNANHVGALFRLEETNLAAIPPWEPSKLLAASGVNIQNLVRRSEGKIYIINTSELAGANGTWTGTVRPTHDTGTENDGDGNALPGTATRAGVPWTFQSKFFGIARIVGFTSGTVATADVIDRLPASVVSAGSATWAFGAWSADQGYPSVVTYFGDRLVFANTPEQPQTEWASKTGDYNNFGVSSPIESDDAITQTLNARQVNAIRELVPLDQLLALTSNSIWASPKRGETWTPDTIGFDPQSYDGSANLRAIIVGGTAIHADNYAKKVRDIAFSFESDKFVGNELSVFARHLFEDNPIISMDYQREPFGLLWCILTDGTGAGLTYLRDHEVVAWWRFDTDGTFEDVCVIPEDDDDGVYFIVKRSFGRFVERLARRDVADIDDGFFVDCGLTYDGRNTAATTMTLSGAVWAAGSSLTLTASAATFLTTDVGNEVWMRAVDSETDPEADDYGVTHQVKCVVTAYTSTTIVTVEPDIDVPTELQATAVTDWTLAKDVMSGLGHLETETVAIQADGQSLPQQTVTSGIVTLAEPAGVVHIGLPYTCEIETLDINVFGRESVRDTAKQIPSFSVLLEKTRGLRGGRDAEHLEDLRPSEDEDFSVKDSVGGPHRFYIANSWNENGRLLLRQDEPLPATILAVTPDVQFGKAG